MKFFRFPFAFLSLGLTTARPFLFSEDITTSSSLFKPVILGRAPPDALAKRVGPLVEVVKAERAIIGRNAPGSGSLSRRSVGAFGHALQPVQTVKPEPFEHEHATHVSISAEPTASGPASPKTQPQLLWATDNLTNFYARDSVHGRTMKPFTQTPTEREHDIKENRNWPTHVCRVLDDLGCEKANVQMAHLPFDPPATPLVPYAKVTGLQPQIGGSDEGHIYADGKFYRKPLSWSLSLKGLQALREEREWKRKNPGVHDLKLDPGLERSRDPGSFAPLTPHLGTHGIV